MARVIYSCRLSLSPSQVVCVSVLSIHPSHFEQYILTCPGGSAHTHACYINYENSLQLYRHGHGLTYFSLRSCKRFPDLCIPLYIQLNQKKYIMQTHVPIHVYYSTINIGRVEPAQLASQSHK